MPKVALDKTRARKAQGRMGAGPLANRLVKVFQGGKRLSLAQAIETVLLSGYKANPKHLSTVGNVLARDKRFKYVRSGHYALKG